MFQTGKKEYIVYDISVVYKRGYSPKLDDIRSILLSKFSGINIYWPSNILYEHYLSITRLGKSINQISF